MSYFQHIDLTNTKVSAEAVSALKARHPKLEVEAQAPKRPVQQNMSNYLPGMWQQRSDGKRSIKLTESHSNEPVNGATPK